MALHPLVKLAPRSKAGRTLARVALAGLTVLGVASGAHAATTFEDDFHSFTVCDGSFFRKLNADAAAWRAVAPLQSKDDQSWIVVPYRGDDKQRNEVTFSTPVTVNGVRLLGYFDEVYDLGVLGMIYYWGFRAEGRFDDVVSKLKPLIERNDRLRSGGTPGDPQKVVARTEIKWPDSSWLALDTPSGTAAGLKHIERVFLIDDDATKHPGTVRVECSLQGGVDAVTLKQSRPDIAPEKPSQAH